MKRNYGLDLLRLVLMFLVAVLHILGHGGVLQGAEQGSVAYRVAWLMETLAYCAVNCYALITGYVYADKQTRLSSYVLLWLQVLCYSIGIAACGWILNPEKLTAESLQAFLFPVSGDRYWYFSTYTGLFLLIPLLNAGLAAFSRKQATVTLAVLFTAFSVIPTFSDRDVFATNEGYSTLWLLLMYLLGASIRKFGFAEYFSAGKGMVLYLGSCGIAWGIKLIWADGIKLIDYPSPLMVLAAMGLFLAFQKVRIPTRMQKWIAILAPGAFGVYLIHEHPYIRNYLIMDRFAFLMDYSVPVMVLAVLGIALGIFGACLAVDLVRHWLYCRLKLKESLGKLENKLLRSAAAEK